MPYKNTAKHLNENVYMKLCLRNNISLLELLVFLPGLFYCLVQNELDKGITRYLILPFI